MLIKIFVRTFSSTEDCELFESILETRWPNLLQQVKGVRFRAMKNPKTPNVSVVLWAVSYTHLTLPTTEYV